jgi:hypothetical protein
MRLLGRERARVCGKEEEEGGARARARREKGRGRATAAPPNAGCARAQPHHQPHEGEESTQRPRSICFLAYKLARGLARENTHA